MDLQCIAKAGVFACPDRYTRLFVAILAFAHLVCAENTTAVGRAANCDYVLLVLQFGYGPSWRAETARPSIMFATETAWSAIGLALPLATGDLH